jgi:hypothetical protein
MFHYFGLFIGSISLPFLSYFSDISNLSFYITGTPSFLSSSALTAESGLALEIM